jgi:hypothetical protein
VTLVKRLRTEAAFPEVLDDGLLQQVHDVFEADPGGDVRPLERGMPLDDGRTVDD